MFCLYITTLHGYTCNFTSSLLFFFHCVSDPIRLNDATLITLLPATCCHLLAPAAPRKRADRNYATCFLRGDWQRGASVRSEQQLWGFGLCFAGARSGVGPNGRGRLALLPDNFQVIPLSFSRNLDRFNPNIPEWRDDVGQVVTKLLAKVRSLHFTSFPVIFFVIDNVDVSAGSLGCFATKRDESLKTKFQWLMMMKYER